MDSLDAYKTVNRKNHHGEYTLAAGQLLGQYRIIQALGRGGMGEVYEVEHETLGRRFALKLLPEDFAAQSGALERFRREARVMANLEHSNIIRVDDFGETEGRYWLRMELAGGVQGSAVHGSTVEVKGQKPVVSLEDLAKAKGGRIPQEELAGILKQILEGLAYAHGHGAIHRDLKPSNILFSGGLAKIADFGLVRLVGEEWVRSQAQVSVQRSMDLRQGYGPQVSIGEVRTIQKEADEGTSTRSMLGTYEYMSPEQKRGEEATAQSDLYAVGLMAFKLLTGQNPGVKPPSRVAPGVVGDWDGFVERALEERAGERWPDAKAMAGALEGIAREIRQLEVGKQAAVQKAEEDRRAREEAERKARAEAEARRALETLEARRRTEEQRRREAEESRLAEQGRAAVADKTKGGGKGWMWILAALIVVGGAVAFWPQERPSPAATVAATDLPAATSPAKPPLRERAATPAPAIQPTAKQQDMRMADLGLDLVWVEAGTFRMGSENGESNEKPVRTVQITKGYWMGKTEVSNGQYQRFLRESSYDGTGEADGDYLKHFKGNSNMPTGDEYPMVWVSWKNADAFCKWLTGRERANLPPDYEYRLPTEAEWEYAARGGTNTASHRFTYAGSDNLGEVAWYSGNSGNQTKPVGTRTANVLGLYDMSGNVWEWCEDWYAAYNPQDTKDPKGPRMGSGRVIRGGSWNLDAALCRVADRPDVVPQRTLNGLGFRVVLAAPVQ